VHLVALTALSSGATQYVDQNKALGSIRTPILVASVAAVALVGAGGAVLARSSAAARERFQSWVVRLRPLLVLWALPPLLVRGVFSDDQTFLAVASSLLVVGLEWSVRSSKPATRPAGTATRSARPGRWWPPALLVALMTASVFAFACHGSIRLHDKMLTSNLDFGLFENLFWNTLRGHHGVALGWPYFGEHAEFLLYALLPIYWLFPYSETLLVMQSAFIVGAAVPLYLLAWRWLRHPWQAVALVAAYLAFPSVHGSLFYDFHFLPLSVFFLLWGAFFYAKRSWVPFWVSVLFALSCREDVALGIALVGLGLVLLGRTRKVGWTLAGLGTVWFVVVKLVWMERFGSQMFSGFYAELIPAGQQGFGAVVRTVMANPLYTLSRIVTEQKLVLALQLTLPLAFLPLRQKATAILFLPGLVVVGLSASGSAVVDSRFHYAMHFVPYLFVATIIALATRPSTWRRAAITTLLVGSLISAVQYSAFFGRRFRTSFHDVSFDWTSADRERVKNFNKLVRAIPADASVSAGEHEGPHLSRRDRVMSIKERVKGMDYVVYSQRSLRWGGAENVAPALSSGTHGVVDIRGDFTLLRRGHDTRRNAKALRMLEGKE